MKRAVLFLNGELVGEKNFYKDYINSNDIVICADGGAEYAYDLGITPQLILGDMDSISNKVLAYYKKIGVRFERYPVEKDKTDTQIILERLMDKGFSEIIIFAALGGRFDHSLANLYLVESLTSAKTPIRLVNYKEIVELIINKRALKGLEGKTISLVPLTDEVRGVYLSGFKYELENETFKRGSTLGISNIITATEAKIKIRSGRLLMIINE